MKQQHHRHDKSQHVSTRRARGPLIEPLEQRQLMHSVIDLRLAGGGNSATVSTVGQQVNLEIWVTITGHDSDLTNDGFQSLTASFLSTNITGGSVQGTLAAQYIAPFNGGGASTGAQVDLDGDGDLDVGSNNNATDVGFFRARSGTMTIDGATVSGTSKSWKIGTATFTVTGFKDGVQTNLVARTRQDPDAFVLLEDGAAQSPRVGSVMTAGAGVVLKRTPGAAGVHGRVYNDKNANGIFDGADTGISNFRVFLDKDFDGALDSNEVSVPVSATGTYHITGVESGVYRVREVVRTGWRQTSPALGYFEVVLGYASDVKNLTFANTDTVLIKGRVWMDANKNKFIDNGEGYLPNWMLYLDHNKNGVLDKGDDWTLSDANGNYRFFNLPAGNYHVRATTHSKYLQTAPGGTGSFWNLTLAAAGTTSNKNFGFKRLK
ncbi:MAG: hypothetical protein QOE14_2273 [Humisphaera sp.]|nr:hypothetical protein [Humisphaera sp.]